MEMISDAVDFADCHLRCLQNEDCLCFSFMPGFCFLNKKTVDRTVEKLYPFKLLRVRLPNNEQTLRYFTTLKGARVCMQDSCYRSGAYDGNNIVKVNERAKNVEECLWLCKITPGCVLVSFNTVGNWCALKHTRDETTVGTTPTMISAYNQEGC